MRPSRLDAHRRGYLREEEPSGEGDETGARYFCCRRCQRVFLSSFLCLCLRIFLRRFLMIEPITYLSSDRAESYRFGARRSNPSGKL